MRSGNERGAALLTVLLLTATLAVLAVGMTELMTRSLRRASASEARDQAFWATAGLEWAAIDYLRRQGENVDVPAAPLFREPVVLPFEGGFASISFAEESNCFNVNDLLARGDDGEWVADEAAAERFAALIESLGGTRTGGLQLAARIADFADTDERPQAGGADDYDYRRRPVPYRTTRGLLASVSELRAISGYSRDVYRQLLPYLCALPTDEPQLLNVNTMTIDDAPLLKAAAGDALTLAGVAQLISMRTPAGYEDVSAFMEQPLLAGADLPNDFAGLLTTKSEHLTMEIVLEAPVGRLRQVSRVYRAGGEPRVVERVLGERLP